MIIKKQTVETINYALNILYDLNKSILEHSHNENRLKCAVKDLKKNVDALNDFGQLLNNFQLGRDEMDNEIYYYL